MPDEVKALYKALYKADWWSKDSGWVRARDVPKTPNVQLLGFRLGVTRREKEVRDDISRMHPGTLRALSESPNQMKNVEYILIGDRDLTGESSRWLKYCRNLKYVHFRECKIDADTIAALQLNSDITCLILQSCDFENPETLAGLPNVRVIQLVDTPADSNILIETRPHLTDTMLQSFRTDGDAMIPLLPPAEPIHRTDTKALARIRKAMRRMSAKMTEIGTPKDDSGLTVADIEKVEKQIGYRLPKDLRFALTQNTGQFDGVVCLLPFQQVHAIADRTHFRQTSNWMQSTFTWFTLRDARGRWHYPLVTFMGEDANDVCLNLVTGEVIFREPAEGVVLAPDLGAFFEHFAQLLETNPVVDLDEAFGGGRGYELYSSDLVPKDAVEFGK